MCLTRAANEQRALEEQQLATALAEQSHLSAEVHGRVVAARRRLAHVLHSSVQGELVAAALMMHGAATPAPMRPADGRSVGGTVSEILGRVLREVADEKSRPRIPTSDARQQITELVGMWSARGTGPQRHRSRRLAVAVGEPGTPRACDRRPSEGFTNAIRHGTGGTLSLTMVVDPRTSVICIGIRSPDGSPATARTGWASPLWQRRSARPNWCRSTTRCCSPCAWTDHLSGGVPAVTARCRNTRTSAATAESALLVFPSDAGRDRPTS